jgi:2-polyprenyl-3-methyl-5-hydroxy-6-metoxy-1,4-benzoquinol methylase
MIPSLSHRSLDPERMDSPDCDRDLLLRTVDQFQITNGLFSRFRTILRRWVLDDMRRNPAREYHFVDLGAGGLDIPDWLIRRARREGLKLRVTAVESDARIVEHVRSRASSAIRLVCGDALAFLKEVPDVDYIFCNHFLHHVPDADLPGFLRSLADAARRRFIVSDLLRSRWSYVGYAAFSGLFLHRSFARADGLLSIRRGFLAEELLALARSTGLAGCVEVHPLAGGRLVLTGRGESGVGTGTVAL